jgi:hypothetical protein
VLVEHFKVIEPEDWIVVELGTHERLPRDTTRNEIVPVKPFCAATMIVAIPDEPVLKLRDETLGVTVMSWKGVAIIIIDSE